MFRNELYWKYNISPYKHTKENEKKKINKQSFVR